MTRRAIWGIFSSRVIVLAQLQENYCALNIPPYYPTVRNAIIDLLYDCTKSEQSKEKVREEKKNTGEKGKKKKRRTTTIGFKPPVYQTA